MHEKLLTGNYFQTLTRRSSYDESFRLKAIELVIQEGNRAAAHKVSIDESVVRRWRRQVQTCTFMVQNRPVHAVNI